VIVQAQGHEGAKCQVAGGLSWVFFVSACLFSQNSPFVTNLVPFSLPLPPPL
jgi:hypothetical protein